jgi:hypothetical protein
LDRASRVLEARGYRTHEFGDSVLLERRRCGADRSAAKPGSAPSARRPASAPTGCSRRASA